MRFKLLAGKHQTGTGRHGDNNLKNYAAYRNGQPQRHPFTDEELSNIVESDTDLAARFGAEKFERLDKPSKKGK